MVDPNSEASMRTLWMGDLAYWMDENFLYTLFGQAGELTSAKVIRNKLNGQSEGYGFLEFRTHEGADLVLRTYNGQPMPNAPDQVFRLNWAAFGVGKGNPEDPGSGRSKGYGFVRFGSETERDRALLEMNGQYLSSRPIRVSLATAKKPTIAGTTGATASAPPDNMDPSNTTLFIGGLSASVSEDQLRSIFGRFGEIIYTKIPQGKGCGFVQFVDRKAAEGAMGEMNGQVIGNSAVRISWGRSSNAGKVMTAGSTGAATVAAPAAFPFQAGVQYPNYGYDASTYAAYSAYGSADAYSAAYGYGQGYPTAAYGGMPAVGAAQLQAANGQLAAVAGATGVTQAGGYDPLGPIDVDKMNAAFMQRHQPALLGSFLQAI